MIRGNRMYKYEKLRSTTAIDALFRGGATAYAYPIRATFRAVTAGNYQPVARFMITVPKRKLRHAVDRVAVRRRIREAYRLNRGPLYAALAETGVSVEVAFIYLADKVKGYASIEPRMREVLRQIAMALPAEAEKINAMTDADK